MMTPEGTVTVALKIDTSDFDSKMRIAASDLRALERSVRWLTLSRWLLVGLLIVLAFLLGAVSAQAEEPKPVWTVTADAGPATVSTNEETKPSPFARLTVSGEPWLRWEFGGRGDLTRTTDGGAFTIEDFTSFASIEALAYARYRIKNSPVTIGAVGAVTWSREASITSPRDPRLWTAEAVLCLDRFVWWSQGGIACLGAGKRGPVGSGGAVSFSATQPIQGNVYLTVDADIPFVQLPAFARALPGAITSAPLTGPPSPEQIRGVAQKLPIAVRVGVLVRLKSFKF